MMYPYIDIVVSPIWTQYKFISLVYNTSVAFHVVAWVTVSHSQVHSSKVALHVHDVVTITAAATTTTRKKKNNSKIISSPHLQLISAEWRNAAVFYHRGKAHHSGRKLCS